MWARITSSKTDPSRLSEAKRIFDEDVLPAAKQQKGFKGAVWLSDPSTGKGAIVGMWETKEDMIASEESGYWKEQVTKFLTLMGEPVKKEYFEVTSEAGFFI